MFKSLFKKRELSEEQNNKLQSICVNQRNREISLFSEMQGKKNNGLLDTLIRTNLIDNLPSDPILFCLHDYGMPHAKIWLFTDKHLYVYQTDLKGSNELVILQKNAETVLKVIITNEMGRDITIHQNTVTCTMSLSLREDAIEITSLLKSWLTK